MNKQMTDQMGEWLMMCMQRDRRHDQEQKAVVLLYGQMIDG